MLPFESVFFLSASCFQSAYILWHLSVLHSFLWLINIPFMWMPHFVYPFIIWQIFGHMFSFLFGILLRMELLGHMVSHFGDCKTVFHSSCTILHFHPQCARFHFISSPATIICFYCSHPHRCEAASPCGFGLHFLIMENDLEYLFLCLLAVCLSSSAQCLFQSFSIFNWVVCLSVVEL